MKRLFSLLSVMPFGNDIFLLIAGTPSDAGSSTEEITPATPATVVIMPGEVELV